ncbi:MAG: hypothetical protein M0Z75_10145 [Nitrospiraceae bacterium]|nr:hypothetical protein [Nitrospiraceae bacterium]
MWGIARQGYIVLRQEGLVRFWRRFLFRSSRVHRFFIFRLDLTGQIPEFRVPPEVEIREVSIQELRSLRESQGRNLPAEFYRDRITTRGERCFCAFVSKKLAFISWISRTGSSGFFKPGPFEAEIDGVFCLPEFRGMRLQTLSFIKIAGLLREEGIRGALVAVHFENIAALKSISRAGFTQIGEFRKWNMFRWRPKRK